MLAAVSSRTKLVVMFDVGRIVLPCSTTTVRPGTCPVDARARADLGSKPDAQWLARRSGHINLGTNLCQNWLK